MFSIKFYNKLYQIEIEYDIKMINTYVNICAYNTDTHFDNYLYEWILTSGNGGFDIIAPVAFCRALIWRRALKGARHIGQLFAWYRRESAQLLHRHRCLHGNIKVSRTSHIQITHSDPLSSVSSSLPCCWKINWRETNIK